ASWFKSVRPFGRLRGRTNPAAVKKQQEPRRRLGDTRLLGARGCLLPRLAFFPLEFSAPATMKHPTMVIAAPENNSVFWINFCFAEYNIFMKKIILWKGG
ncbi:MAG: hypothetical protein IKQ17_11450, partial [Kiritimatiellae bacterium]|nr:hypothetical protein [Kiritimatiellia bacterium]